MATASYSYSRLRVPGEDRAAALGKARCRPRRRLRAVRKEPRLHEAAVVVHRRDRVVVDDEVELLGDVLLDRQRVAIVRAGALEVRLAIERVDEVARQAPGDGGRAQARGERLA